jgi:hypothetical protein
MDKFYKLSITQLLLILAFIIFIIPLVLTRDALGSWFVFADKGEIGDTIGGITAPFINSIAAILVFIAFKEQVKANNLIKEQQYFQHITDQIHRLEDNFIDLPEVISIINKGLQESKRIVNYRKGDEQISYAISTKSLNKAIYLTVVLQQTYDITANQIQSNTVLLEKLRLLYIFIYQNDFQRLSELLEGISKMRSKNEVLVNALINNIDITERQFTSYLDTP